MQQLPDPESAAEPVVLSTVLPGLVFGIGGMALAGRIDDPDKRLEAEERLGMGSSPHDSR